MVICIYRARASHRAKKNTNEGPAHKFVLTYRLNQSNLDLNDLGSLIIDREVVVVSNPKDVQPAELAPTIFVVILSAPKNIIHRKITRQGLHEVANNRNLKWAFIIGQTMPDIQVHE